MFIKRNLLKLFAVIVLVIILIWLFLYLKSDTDYIKINIALSTLGQIFSIPAFFFLLWNYWESKNKEIGLRKDEVDKFWHEYCPVIIIGSPCDLSQNRCDIDLNDNRSNPTDERGVKYFSIGNIGTRPAFNIKIFIDKNLEFNNPKKHFISNLQSSNLQPYQQSFDYICSKYHINPDNMEITYEIFYLCDFLESCGLEGKCKKLFIKLEYETSPNSKISKKIESIFECCLECKQNDNSIKISHILMKEYRFLKKANNKN